MSKSDVLRIPDYLEHIIESIHRIKEYTDDMVEITFLKDKQVQDAVIRNIEIMGEASKNIERYHPSFAEEHDNIPWHDIYLMRNRVSHGYFSVDLELIWKTIENDLPTLEQQIQTLYKEIIR